MKAKILLLLGLTLLLGCASTPKQSLYEILEPQACPLNNFRGHGIAGDEMAAIDIARAMLASNIQSSISVQSEHVNEVINEVDSEYYKKQIISSFSLSNANDASVVFKKQQGKEIGVVVCMSRSDAAKGFMERQRLATDSLELTSHILQNTEHPKQKNDAWQRTQMLWYEILRIQNLLKGWGVAKDEIFNSASEINEKTKEGYKSYCKTAKFYWNPEQENLYSGIAFSRLSQKLKIEKYPCVGNGISLIYKNTEQKCKHAGTFKCSHQPSMLISSCKGVEYRLIKSPDIESFHQKEAVALERLQTKIKDENFWNEWEHELKQWRPQCE